MSEPTLFDDEPVLTAGVAHARRDDPDTSHAAAASIDVDTLRQSQRAVLAVLQRGRGDFATISKAYDDARGRDPDYFPNLSDSGLRTRVSELRDRGYVRDSGERVTLPSGRQAIVWEATS